MKLKIAITLLPLTISAHSQLITAMEESVFLITYQDGALFTPARAGPSALHDAHGRIQSALSVRDNPPATPAFAESRFASVRQQSPVSDRFLPALDRETAGTTRSHFTDFISFDASFTRANSSPVSPDREVIALIAASKIP